MALTDHERMLAAYDNERPRAKYRAVTAEQDVSSIPDSELLRRAVINARGRRKGMPRWAIAMETFGLGSTYAWQLCVRVGVDPDEIPR